MNELKKLEEYHKQELIELEKEFKEGLITKTQYERDLDGYMFAFNELKKNILN